MNVTFSGENLFDRTQLAFIVNHTTNEIIVNKSGHATVILRNHDFYKRGDTLSGGWIFLYQKKLILHSGSLGKVKPKYHEQVICALEEALGFRFRYIKE